MLKRKAWSRVYVVFDHIVVCTWSTHPLQRHPLVGCYPRTLKGKTDRRASQYFYFDDIPGRRLRPDLLTRAEALEQAKALARDERDKEG